MSDAPVTEPTAHRAPPHAGATTAKRLVITSGPREGVEIDLPAEQLTIGRSNESGLVIRDDYTSTHHARLMLWNDQWVIQDLDSTNGTFLDGTRVTLPTPVPLGTPVTIGTTSFELRHQPIDRRHGARSSNTRIPRSDVPAQPARTEREGWPRPHRRHDGAPRSTRRDDPPGHGGQADVTGPRRGEHLGQRFVEQAQVGRLADGHTLRGEP